MTFAKLSEGGPSSSLGGRYQLLLAPRSKIANAEVSLCTEKNVVITTMDFSFKSERQPCHVVVPLNLLLCPSTRGRTPDSSQAPSRPSRNSLGTSPRRDPPASSLASRE